MGKKKKEKARVTPAGAELNIRWDRWAPVLLCAAVVAFYWVPLTSEHVSIQWDAVDVHYTQQKYFAERLLSGNLPFWTPYIFSGYPFLADPQTGAWYPLNWPFFLLGITPRSIGLEILLHALLACTGAYFLALKLLGRTAPAIAAGLFYGLSGSFTGHTSHLGIFQTAAWLPWLLLAFKRSVELPSVRNVMLTAAAGGVMALAGHFQTALYAFTALALFGAAEIWRNPRLWRRAAAVLAAASVVAVLLTAVQTLPGLELVSHSIRASLDAGKLTDGILHPKAMLTLLFPNALGAVSGEYTGPVDVTQYYFYAGILFLPLAALGMGNRGIRLSVILLVAPALWYALGPGFGLYRLIALLPGFHSVRAPVHVWFVIGLGLAVAAAAGVSELLRRWPARYVAPLLLAFVFGDLLHWNGAGNRVAFAQARFEQLYGSPQRALQQVASSQPPLTRFMAPEKLMALGPFNAPLDVKLEATYGYNPLKLTAYDEYLQAAAGNPKLIDGLNVSRVLNMNRGSVDEHPSALPRAYFAKSVAYAKTAQESRKMLATLNPAETTVILGEPLAIEPDNAAVAEVTHQDERSLKVRYRTASDGLLRIAVPYYPGWQAFVDDQPRPVLRADHAFIGVPVPAGAHELTLRFQSTYFSLGAGISLATALLIAAGIFFSRSGRAAGREHSGAANPAACETAVRSGS
ncbi:MAG TPA: YfhO family protein [Bryobacteraceae bacterium]|nr:YfhO family protein [Bryobacteraceae bacterium]HPU72628.1 YfhO family protein [Bryobacteraceae bacterium]